MAQQDKYILLRDNAASNRLTTQHHIFISKHGYHIHPDVIKDVFKSDKPRIADLACGNGIWGIDVARQYPDADVVCMDISDAQFPSASTYFPANSKSNLTFKKLAILGSIPDELQGTFDLVHLRLFIMTAPLVDDPKLYLDYFGALLKPGGWLQWSDPLAPIVSDVSADDVQRYQLDTVEHAMNIVKMPPAGLINAAEKWTKVVTKASITKDFTEFLSSRPEIFDYARADLPPVRPELLKLETDNWYASSCEWYKALKGTMNPESDELRDLTGRYEAGMKYIADGGLVTFTLIVGLARKKKD